MNKTQLKLEYFKRKSHALLPTPVHELKHLSSKYNCKVFIKRDDLTGFGFGGNKARKLDFLIQEALDLQCDTIIATGGNQSNFCRIAAAYGSIYGMKVHLILGGETPAVPTGNLRLNHILNAKCHHVKSMNWQDWENEAIKLEAKLKKEGCKVYKMPIGGSTPTGCLGYIEAISEIIEDEKKFNIKFDTIVHASGSAGTQSGLLLGKKIYNWQGKILGFSVAQTKAILEEKIYDLSCHTAKLLNTAFCKKDILVDDSFLGKGYAQKTKECIRAVEYFAKKHGIFLDHVYTGKAAAGLINYLKTNRFQPDSAILFIHTGGNIELFV